MSQLGSPHRRALSAALALLAFLPLFGIVPGWKPATAEACPAEPSPSGTETRPYRETGGKTYLLQIYQPAKGGCAKSPVLIYFHGGGWSHGSRQQFAVPARLLTKAANIHVISVDYPLNRNPVEATQFGAAAVCWIIKRADELGIDPRRVALAGGSAGGQIAAAVALRGADKAIPECAGMSGPLAAALVLYNPVLDLGGKWARVIKQDLQSVSPMALASAGLPPTLIVQGTADTTTPASVARRFADRIAELGGGPVELIEYEGREHGFAKRRRTGDLAKTTEDVLNFLRRLKWI
jgi:acetyl esterase